MISRFHCMCAGIVKADPSVPAACAAGSQCGRDGFVSSWDASRWIHCTSRHWYTTADAAEKGNCSALGECCRWIHCEHDNFSNYTIRQMNQHHPLSSIVKSRCLCLSGHVAGVNKMAVDNEVLRICYRREGDAGMATFHLDILRCWQSNFKFSCHGAARSTGSSWEPSSLKSADTARCYPPVIGHTYIALDLIGW